MSTKMNTTVCTLFEGHYHYGVAGLTNSLYKQGFRGVIYAGYRGELPTWAAKANKQTVGKWTNASVLDIADGLQLIFLPLSTDYHLTNYKPDFMLELLEGPAKQTGAIFYFDPDIFVVKQWQYFEDWVTCGVALCEDVNSPLPENHPRRVGWRRYFGERSLNLNSKGTEYANGGYIGLEQDHKQFLSLWSSFNKLMSETTGSLKVTRIPGGASFSSKGFANCFDIADQDALNAAIEATDLPVSIIGQEAMAFKPRAALMPHALGPRKPWNLNYLKDALLGKPPRLVDKVFWQYADGPIRAFSPILTKRKRSGIKFASLIGRIYRRR